MRGSVCADTVISVGTTSRTMTTNTRQGIVVGSCQSLVAERAQGVTVIICQDCKATGKAHRQLKKTAVPSQFRWTKERSEKCSKFHDTTYTTQSRSLLVESCHNKKKALCVGDKNGEHSLVVCTGLPVKKKAKNSRSSACCIPHCRTAINDEIPGHGMPSFFPFPSTDAWKALWIRNIERDTGEHLTISPFSTVCSRHFKSQSFYKVEGRRHLRFGAAPTMFGFDMGKIEDQPNQFKKQQKTLDDKTTEHSSRTDSCSSLPLKKEPKISRSSACCVPNCCTIINREIPGHGKPCFFPFPSNGCWRALWLHNIRRDKGKHFTISPFSTVCSLHFTPNSFNEFEGQRHLNPGAAPTLFECDEDHPEQAGKGQKTSEDQKSYPYCDHNYYSLKMLSLPVANTKELFQEFHHILAQEQEQPKHQKSEGPEVCKRTYDSEHFSDHHRYSDTLANVDSIQELDDHSAKDDSTPRGFHKKKLIFVGLHELNSSCKRKTCSKRNSHMSQQENHENDNHLVIGRRDPATTDDEQNMDILENPALVSKDTNEGITDTGEYRYCVVKQEVFSDIPSSGEFETATENQSQKYEPYASEQRQSQEEMSNTDVGMYDWPSLITVKKEIIDTDYGDNNEVGRLDDSTCMEMPDSDVMSDIQQSVTVKKEVDISDQAEKHVNEVNEGTQTPWDDSDSVDEDGRKIVIGQSGFPIFINMIKCEQEK